MNIRKVLEARKAAQQFVAATDKLMVNPEWERANNSHNGVFYYGSVESGDVKRKSMDLTRALAELRKPM